MLTTIFTGHTLNLKDIVSVGPIMQESDGENACIFIKIYLKHNIKIKHVHHRALPRMFNQKEIANAWDAKFDDIFLKRQQLIEAWEIALFPKESGNAENFNPVETLVTADDRPRYTSTDKDLIAAHSSIIISMLIDSPNFRQMKPKVQKLVESGRLTYSVKDNIVELFLENDQGGMEVATWDKIAEVLKKKGGEG